MRFTMKRRTDAIWGGKCQTNNGKWTCREGNIYKFKGETSILRFDSIEEVVGNEVCQPSVLFYPIIANRVLWLM